MSSLYVTLKCNEKCQSRQVLSPCREILSKSVRRDAAQALTLMSHV